jgi:hypothetical protein
VDEWKNLLKGDPSAWLLEGGDPSVRYFALTKILERPEEDADVVAARQAIEDSAAVHRILDAQRPQGYWDRDRRPYQGASKHLITLEHLGYRGQDERLHRSIAYLFANAQMEDGAFSSDKLERGRSAVVPCFTANAVRFLHWFGYGEDARTKKALDYLLNTQLTDGGWLCFERVKKTHACFWATAKVLRALEALPPEQQTPEVQHARQRGVDLFLDHGLYHHHSEFGKVSTRWFEFARPLFASTDVLEVLGLVAPFVSPDDERIQEGLEIVLGKQDEQGRWPAEREVPVRKTFPIPFEEVEQPSKWVTLHALLMLKSLVRKADHGKNQPE